MYFRITSIIFFIFFTIISCQTTSKKRILKMLSRGPRLVKNIGDVSAFKFVNRSDIKDINSALNKSASDDNYILCFLNGHIKNCEIVSIIAKKKISKSVVLDRKLSLEMINTFTREFKVLLASRIIIAKTMCKKIENRISCFAEDVNGIYTKRFISPIANKIAKSLNSKVNNTAFTCIKKSSKFAPSCYFKTNFAKSTKTLNKKLSVELSKEVFYMLVKNQEVHTTLRQEFYRNYPYKKGKIKDKYKISGKLNCYSLDKNIVKDKALVCDFKTTQLN